MEVSMELHSIMQVLMAFILGGILGWERERRGRPAGIRTFAAIAIGACVFGLISIHGLPAIGLNPGDRIASNVVVGVGFLGAGVIFHRDGVHMGLTTAATLWSTAAVGLAVAFQMYTIAILVTVIMLLLLWLPRLSWWQWVSNKNRKF